MDYLFILLDESGATLSRRSYALACDVDASALSFSLMRDYPKVAVVEISRGGHGVMRRSRVGGKTVLAKGFNFSARPA